MIGTQMTEARKLDTPCARLQALGYKDSSALFIVFAPHFLLCTSNRVSYLRSLPPCEPRAR